MTRACSSGVGVGAWPIGTTLRLGTRASRLALWQARLCADRLRSLGADVDVVEISTSGDRDQTRAISELGSDTPFTDDIERALLAGRIDLAVHCLKDMPVKAVEGLRVAAMLERGDAREALVSRDGRGLAALPPGARVGTSSPRRAAQLRHLRPDLTAVPIRGTVENRVRQVRAGPFDAAILAVAGLDRLSLRHEVAEALPIEQFMPAPAQAIIAIQVRAADAAASAIAARLDHPPTRLAATAELEFLRPFDGCDDVVVAAYASVGPGIKLSARLLAPDGRMLWDAAAAGGDPHDVARDAARRAAEQLGLDRECMA